MRNPDYFQIFWALENQTVIGELPRGRDRRGDTTVGEVRRACSPRSSSAASRGHFAPCDAWEVANILWTVANGLIQTQTSAARRKLRRRPLDGHLHRRGRSGARAASRRERSAVDTAGAASGILRSAPVTSSHAGSRGGGERDGRPFELKVRNIVAEQLGVDLAEVRPDARILDDLGADSLDVVEMVMSLEEAFDIEVPDEDVEELRTVADVERYVASALAA